MQRFSDLAGAAQSQLTSTADAMTEGAGEKVVWRHQDFTSPSEGASAASGIDPEGLDFDTTDFVIEALRDPDADATIFYMQVVPSMGDLIITLRGHHDSISSARQADPSGFYRVESCQEFRDGNGELTSCRVEAPLDQTRDYKK
jgi:hypothetical protein